MTNHKHEVKCLFQCLFQYNSAIYLSNCVLCRLKGYKMLSFLFYQQTRLGLKGRESGWHGAREIMKVTKQFVKWKRVSMGTF